MAPIIRKPALDEKRHALQTRPHTPLAEVRANPAVAPVATASKPVQHAAPTPSAAPPAGQDNAREMEREVERRVAAARQALQAEADELRAAAREAGHAEGMRQAADTLSAAQAAQQAQLETVLQALDKRYRLDLARIEDEAAAIAYEACCKIVGHYSVSAGQVLAVVQQAMQQVQHGHVLSIRLAAADLALLKTLPAFAAMAGFEWKADEQIAMGGCIIETTLGKLDARLETQLAKLADVLLTVRAASEPATSAEVGSES